MRGRSPAGAAQRCSRKRRTSADGLRAFGRWRGRWHAALAARDASAAPQVGSPESPICEGAKLRRVDVEAQLSDARSWATASCRTGCKKHCSAPGSARRASD